MPKTAKLSEMNSGYTDPGGVRMKAFLECWKIQTLEYARKNHINSKISYNSPNLNWGLPFIEMPKSIRNFYNIIPQISWVSIFDIEIRPDLIGHNHRFIEHGGINFFNLIDSEESQILKIVFGSENCSDEDYYFYGKNQKGTLRGKDVDSLIYLGAEGFGRYYFLNANEKTNDDELESILYLPGDDIFRFKSFAHLLVKLYLDEYIIVNKLEYPYASGPFYFDGDWSRTCVPLLFDQDEIDSWQASA